MSMNPRTVVLMGGESEEREISLMSGENILKALKSEGIEAEGYDWHPSKIVDFLSRGYERVFIALHGGSGENGAVQAMLDMAGIPYTGIGMRQCAICMDKNVSKLIVSKTDVPVPECIGVCVTDLRAMGDGAQYRIREIVTKIGFPLVVKPSRNGSSVGVSIVERMEDMEDAIKAASVHDDETVMFEQYVCGHELTVAMLNGKALGVCRIVPKGKFYDYDAKYNRDDTEYLVPSGLGDEFDSVVCRHAETVAKALDCMTGVVRIDFLADRDLKPYFLEVNSVPGMTSHSLLPKIAGYAGYSFPKLCRMSLEMC